MALFVGFFCIILSMYGGGFATIPAYLADMFGTQFVGAIHGRLLTAWSTAGILGPVLVNYIRECADRRRRAARAQVYDFTMYILRGPAGGRLHLQLAGASRRRSMVHDGPRSWRRCSLSPDSLLRPQARRVSADGDLTPPRSSRGWRSASPSRGASG